MTTNNQTETAVNPKAPTHYAYHVREGKGSDNFWTRIGSAWAHGDGLGFNIQLNGLVPLDGAIKLRIPTEKRDQSTGE
jgi:hypothetical protein